MLKYVIKKISSHTYRASVGIGSIVLGLILLTFWVSPSYIVRAATVQLQSLYSGTLYYHANRYGGSLWAAAADGINVTVQYTVNAYRADTGQQLLGGDSVPLGTPITFTRSTSTQDVSWFATGHSVDSPYGSLVPSQNTDPFGGIYYGKTAYADPADVGNPVGSEWGPTGFYDGPATGASCDTGSASQIGSGQYVTVTYDYPPAAPGSYKVGPFYPYAIVNVADPYTDSNYAPGGNAWTSYNAADDSMISTALLPPIYAATGTAAWDINAYYPGGPRYALSNTAMDVYNSVSTQWNSKYEYYPVIVNGGYNYDLNWTQSASELASYAKSATSTTVVPALYQPGPMTYTIPFAETYGSLYYEYADRDGVSSTGNASTTRFVESAGCYADSVDPTVSLPTGQVYGGTTSLNSGDSSVPPPTVGTRETIGQYWQNGVISSIDKSATFSDDGSYAGPAGFHTVSPLGGANTSPPLSPIDSPDYNPYVRYGGWEGVYWGDSYIPDYSFVFPEALIAFTINYTQTAAPSQPVITGAATGTTGVTYTYTGSSCVDPKSYRVSYGFDWDNNGSVDKWSPAYPTGANQSTTVASGASTTATYSWSTPGTYTVGLLCQNMYGAASPPATPLTVTISAPPPAVTLYFSSIYWQGGSTSSPQTFADDQNNTPQLTWTSSNVYSCSEYGPWNNPYKYTRSNTLMGSAGNNTEITGGYDYPVISSSTNIYTIACKGPGGTATSSIEVDAIASPPTVSLSIDGQTGTTTVPQGNSDYIEWNPQHATACNATSTNSEGTSASDGGWGGSVSANSWNYQYINTSPPLPIDSYTYSISCTGPGGVATSSIGLIVTLAPPSVDFCSANPGQADTGQQVTWSADQVTGGTPPYTYSWSENDYDLNWNQLSPESTPLLDGSTDESPTVSYPTYGTKYATLTVTDANGISSSPSNCYSLSVSPTVSVNLAGPSETNINTTNTYTVTGNSTEAGDQLTYYFYIPQDDGSYKYDQMPNDGSFVPLSTPETDTSTWTTPGQKYIEAVACDSAWVCSNWTQLNITVNDNTPQPDSCSANVDSAAVNTPVTWSVYTSSSTPTYQWSGTDGLSGSLYNVTKSYNALGSKTAQVKVTSSGESHTLQCTSQSGNPSITINSGLPTVTLVGSIGSGASSAGSILISKSQSLTLHFTANNADTCTASPAGLWADHIQLLDNDNALLNSVTADLFTVDPSTTSVTYTVTCSNANGSASASLRAGVVSVLEF